jgi:hypothetical protein
MRDRARPMIPATFLLAALAAFTSSCVLWESSASLVVATHPVPYVSSASPLLCRDYMLIPTTRVAEVEDLDAHGQMLVFQRAHPEAPPRIARGVPVDGVACVPGTNLVCAIRAGELRVYDLTEPGDAAVVGRCDVPLGSDISHIASAEGNGFVYLAVPEARGSLCVVDAGDPSSPFIANPTLALPTAEVPDSEYLMDLGWVGDAHYSVSQGGRLFILRISGAVEATLDEPLLLPEGFVPTQPDPAALGRCAADGRLYLWTDRSVVVVRDDPSLPVRVECTLSAAGDESFADLAVARTMLYVATSPSGALPGVDLWDLSDPEVPQEVGRFTLGGQLSLGGVMVADVAASPERVFVLQNGGWDWSILRSYDVGDQDRPRELARTTLANTGQAATAYGAPKAGVWALDGFCYALVNARLTCLLAP